MSSEQTYYLTIALINLILAFAGTRIKDTEKNIRSTLFLIGSFFAFSLSWFLYSLQLSIYVEVISLILSTVFVWGITVFSFKRCEVKTPWLIISCLFFINIIAQTLFFIEHNLNYLLHTASIFIPIAFCTCGYLFLKKKVDRNPSDIIISYTCFIMTAVIITRSIALELSPELFSLTKASTQIIWPVFSVISGIFFLLSFTEEVQKKLTTEATIDTLTGLFNRRMFDQKFKLLLPSLSRGKHFGALLYIDLDGFKPINDEFGHHIGDKVLVEFASRLNQSSRSEESIARIGGDEFALLIKNAGHNRTEAYQSAHALALRIQNLMKEPIYIDTFMLKIECSIGVHILTPDAKNTQLAVKAADAAMYQAKKRLHNSIVFSENLNQHKYNLNVGIKGIEHERREIEDLLISLLDKKIDLNTGFPLLINMVTTHFKSEVRTHKRLQSSFSKEQRIDHIFLLDALQKIPLKDNNHIISDNLLLFIKQLELHNTKYNQNLTLNTVKNYD